MQKKKKYYDIYIVKQSKKYMNSATITKKTTIDIKFLIKLILFLLFLGIIVYTGTEYYQQFARNNKENTEQRSNNSKSRTKQNKSDNWKNNKRSGKNEPHKNQDVKKSLKKQLDKVNKEIERLTEKTNKTKTESKLLKKIKITKKRLSHQLKQKGETHWRK